MYSVVSTNLSTRSSLARKLPSLTPGHVLRGVRWNYRILEHIKGDNTHISNVFKAQVVSRDNRVVLEIPEVPQWALIKVASPSDENTTECLQREVLTYRLPGVASAKCFRKLYDIIDDSTIALEWLDTTLAEVKYHPDIKIYSLIKTVLRAAFTSCVILEDHKHVNTDYKPANILISNIRTDRIIAKVGDLGLVVPVGELFHAQPCAMRAPEVFLGKACTEPSQVWAIGAMLLCWIKPGVLGAWSCPHPLINEAWSMAKIQPLFPYWEIPTPEMVEGDILKTAVNSARSLSKEVPELQAILPFDEETKTVEIPQQLRDLLRFILVPDLKTRPSASSVLASREFRTFEDYVSV
ncbi:hypothetical protein N7491_009541 [Penicillium cf. griseofulvum]|uniref:Protein kinase domain-containing protein n=1 Tax=Penicillium cf. griseofulvum TaxID=2972120 RepID=A0A9W9ME03_9EURO|nr:hypothetical protein N7472_004865 [Penicillium cf. griseofulvum]KAJ5424325.1 hypothetical protein N7491_009541 [Penicillium cf. griseofulvum]KAJ5442433.1 hypothetical protein N7445_005440 [Penicillium cf. griseofulvum]